MFEIPRSVNERWKSVNHLTSWEWVVGRYTVDKLAPLSLERINDQVSYVEEVLAPSQSNLHRFKVCKLTVCESGRSERQTILRHCNEFAPEHAVLVFLQNASQDLKTMRDLLSQANIRISELQKRLSAETQRCQELEQDLGDNRFTS